MTVVSHAAGNHRQKPVDESRDDRRTPPDLFAELHRVHRFTVDAAASIENALLPRFWTRARDGLGQSWHGERVWLNPPFSRLEPWLAKAWDEMVHGSCELVVMLLPSNRCDQPFWQTHVETFRDGKWPGSLDRHPVQLTTRFLPGRIRFGFPPGTYRPPASRKKGDRPPHGCVLVRWSLAHRAEGQL